jgi:Na+/alanine symporter
MKQAVVWELSDIGIAVLAVINTLCLVRLSPHAIKITREYFDGFRKRR